MSTRTPNLQPRSQHHNDWGVFDSTDELPNASGAPLSDPEFPKLEAGDVAYVARRRYVCENTGTEGGGDAVWYGESSTTSAPLDLYVDGDSGSDNNSGTQAAPLATITEAEERIPDIVDHTVRVWVQEATSAYDVPTFRARVLRDTIYVVGAADNDNFHFNVLFGPDTGDEGSGGDADRQIVTDGGLGVNTYRGKVVEILSGPAEGDRRLIGDHDDTTLTVSLEFSAALGDDVEFQIVEPSITLTPPGTLTEGFGNGAVPIAINVTDFAPALTLINFRFDSFALNAGAMRVNMIGIDITGAGGTDPRFSGRGSLVRVGGDSRDGLDLDARSGPVFGAPSERSWAGWSMGSSDVGDFIIAEELHAEIVGLVLDRFICQGVELYIQKPWLFNAGFRVFSSPRPSSVYMTGTVGASGGEASGVIVGTNGWGLDVLGNSSVVHLNKIDITAVDEPAVTARRGGVVNFTSNGGSAEGSIGLLAKNGGRITFSEGTIPVTATEAETRIVDAGVNTDQALADYASDGDYTAGGDGSIIQRVPSGFPPP